MGGRAWPQHERELLESHVDQDNWLPTVRAAMPHRTVSALKAKMSKAREALGLGDGREVDAGWMTNARMASRQLAEATLRVGRWS